jgi:hypothetical protein
MNNCEHYEMLLSTGADGQLDGADAGVRTQQAAEPPAPEVWKRIEWETRAQRGEPRRRRLPGWALQVAAVLVVAIGLSFVVWDGNIATAPTQAEIQLGQGSEMSEERFVELTREVLGADPRYHSAMLEIMGQVVRDTTPAGEGSPEELMQRYDESNDGENVELGARIPA